MTAFIRTMFNNTFKTNPSMERAIMTGITRVSKESIFSEMSEKDRSFARAIADGNEIAHSIQDAAGMNIKQYSVYRDRLKKKGIIVSENRGHVKFALPRFAEYVHSQL